MVDEYKARKEARTKLYHANYGIKASKCDACNGSGYYDHYINGRTPECSSCNGTGKCQEKHILVGNKII